MKHIRQIILTSGLLLVLAITAPLAFAQEPPHPPTAGHGATGNQNPPGGGAPIDGGLGIFLALGMAYGIKKASANLNQKDSD